MHSAVPEVRLATRTARQVMHVSAVRSYRSPLLVSVMVVALGLFVAACGSGRPGVAPSTSVKITKSGGSSGSGASTHTSASRLPNRSGSCRGQSPSR
jgi:hypothetical protein